MFKAYLIASWLLIFQILTVRKQGVLLLDFVSEEKSESLCFFILNCSTLKTCFDPAAATVVCTKNIPSLLSEYMVSYWTHCWYH